MKKLLILATLLYSSATYAAVDDVYYCVTDNLTEVTESGNKQYSNQEFKFRWTETEIIYSGGFMEVGRHTVLEHWSSLEAFEASSPFGMTWYRKGTLATTSYNVYGRFTVIFATCEKL